MLQVDIGYQTLMLCSHPLKTYIVHKLLDIANDTADRRAPAAAWELSVCCFSGFGIARSFEDCSSWLTVAASNGIIAAQDYYGSVHDAMEIDPNFVRRPGSMLNSTWSSSVAIGETSGSLPHDAEPTTPPIVDDPGGLDTDLDFSDSEDQPADPVTPVLMSYRTSNLIRSGSDDDLRRLLDEEHMMLNAQDATGNTPLLLAAKGARYEIVELILDQPGVNAGVCNNAGQNVLHYLTGFSDTQIQLLVPRLIERKADPNAEGFSTQQENGSAAFTSGIRSCSILNSILHKNLVLLKCILEAGYSENCVSICRVCEAGSAFRRILAVALSYFQADALEILVAHIKAHKSDQVIELDKIEVWAGHELLPLHKVPFYSVAVTVMDLPESFFRAMYYGANHHNSLRRTIGFLLDAGKDVVTLPHSMLRAAVSKNSLDGVNILLDEGKQRSMPSSWWVRHDGTGMESNRRYPMDLAIISGFRDIFDVLIQQDSTLFSQKYSQVCLARDCQRPISRSWRNICGSFLGRLLHAPRALPPGQHTHRYNLLKVALETIFVARHQDIYFM